MNEVQGNVENGVLIISLTGHIDSANASDVELAIDNLFNENKGMDIIVDTEELKYISSAGLRVLLRLRKKSTNMKVINVTPDIYEIFSMTGFTEIMTIEKAYRQLSVEGCELIGQGANGKVYRLDADTIIKVYMNPDSLAEIHKERELARKAFVLDIPTAIPYDVVKVGDKYGSVFELLNAQSFSKLISSHPEDILKYIELYINLLKRIHNTVVKPEDLPNMNTIAIKWINDLKGELSEDVWNKLYQLISSIPEDFHMLHGDYHTKNIMMQNGEVLLIDMDTLARGNPVFEFAFMYNAYVGYEELLPKEEIGKFLGLNYDQVRTIWNESLKQYFNTDNEEILKEKSQKAKVISYVRILRHCIRKSKDTEEGQKLIKYCHEQLNELVKCVDSLAF